VARDATWKDCELAARDPDRSIAACSKILKRPSSQSHAAAFHHRGQAYAAKGNLDQAISDISAGIRIDPQRPYRWQERGELYARQGKYQQAIADITEAIKRDSTPRAFRFQSRAEAYQSLGDLTRAIADFDEAIRLDPEGRSFRFYARANALRDAGQYDRALADYETALKLAPTNAWILVDRGRTYARMGRSEAAKNDFDSALTLSPSNEGLRRIIEVEVAALPGLSPPSTAQETPPQSSQQPAPAQRSEAAPPGLSPPSTAQKTPPQSPPVEQPAPAQRPEAGPPGQSPPSTAQKTPPQSSPPQQPSFPAFTGLVVDAANLLTPEERARLEAKLEAHQKTYAEVVVATVPSLGGLSSKDYADKLFIIWRLRDVLLLVAQKENKFYIKYRHDFCRTLRDLPGVGPILNKIVTKSQHGDLAGGIEAGVDQLLHLIRQGTALRRMGHIC
jgi:tetratricopeptide (TPR) repeat protein